MRHCLDQGLHSISFGGNLLSDLIQDGRVRRGKLPAQGECQQMPGKGSNKPFLFLEDRVLELDHVTEFVPAEEYPIRIHPEPVLIVIAPTPDRIEIFQSKAKRVEFLVTTRAIGPFTVG